MIKINLGWVVALILFCINVFQFFTQIDDSVTMTHTRDELAVLVRSIIVQQKIIADIGMKIDREELISILQRNCEIVKVDDAAQNVLADNMEFVFSKGKLVKVEDINHGLLEAVVKK